MIFIITQFLTSSLQRLYSKVKQVFRASCKVLVPIRHPRLVDALLPVGVFVTAHDGWILSSIVADDCWTIVDDVRLKVISVSINFQPTMVAKPRCLWCIPEVVWSISTSQHLVPALKKLNSPAVVVLRISVNYFAVRLSCGREVRFHILSAFEVFFGHHIMPSVVFIRKSLKTPTAMWT